VRDASLPPLVKVSSFAHGSCHGRSDLDDHGLMEVDDDETMDDYFYDSCDEMNNNDSTKPLRYDSTNDGELKKGYNDSKWNYDDYDFEVEQDIDEEFLGETINLFPLVERFTLNHFPREIQYWAGVIMRNSCKKDESRGGIRQCSNFECGKWEEFPRQFAKCRRCKRTKYCSKECQLRAWTYHRHWCIASNVSSSSGSSSSSRSAAANNGQNTNTIQAHPTTTTVVPRAPAATARSAQANTSFDAS